tara:strand:+ start:106 stop:492 length:387 start_codon:yes stop_codon:yes gene_type:complete
MFKTYKKYRLIGGIIGGIIALIIPLLAIFLPILEDKIPTAFMILPGIIILFFFILPFHVFGMMIATVLGAIGIDRCKTFDFISFGGGRGFDCTDLMMIFSVILVIFFYFMIGSLIGGFVGLMKTGKKK